MAPLIALTAISVYLTPDQELLGHDRRGPLSQSGTLPPIPAVRWIGAGEFRRHDRLRDSQDKAGTPIPSARYPPHCSWADPRNKGAGSLYEPCTPPVIPGLWPGLCSGIVFGASGRASGRAYCSRAWVGLLAATAFRVLDGLGARPSLSSPVSAVYSGSRDSFGLGQPNCHPSVRAWVRARESVLGSVWLVLRLGAVWIRYMCGLSVAAVQRSTLRPPGFSAGAGTGQSDTRCSGPGRTSSATLSLDHLQVQGQDNVSGVCGAGGP